ncbi:MAG: hypothetical protein KDB37_19035, partial [Ilumatobacter sp.]|nr:hypothetical protein [Ilumatobacter sp.]
LAWLAFQGRWGQREPSFFNGPTGPYAKDRWFEPVSWHEGLRTSSVLVPGGDRLGNDVVGSFCGAVELGSTALTRTLRSPVTALVILGGIVVAAVWLVRSTRWSPVALRPLRTQRAVGQILRASVRVWRGSLGTMMAIGLLYLPVAAVTAVVQSIVLAMPFVDDLVGLAGDRSAVALLISVAIGGLGDLLAFVYIAAVVARSIDDEVESGRGILLSGDEVRRLMGALLRAIVVVGGLILTVVGIPWAIRQLVRYQFVPQAVVSEHRDARSALDRSSDLVRERWWWTAGVVLGVEAVVASLGFGAAVAVLLAVRQLPLWGFNLVSVVIHVVLVPIGAAAITYAYGRLAAAPTVGDED